MCVLCPVAEIAVGPGSRWGMNKPPIENSCHTLGTHVVAVAAKITEFRPCEPSSTGLGEPHKAHCHIQPAISLYRVQSIVLRLRCGNLPHRHPIQRKSCRTAKVPVTKAGRAMLPAAAATVVDVPPPAPLHLLDLCALLSAHVSAFSPPTSAISATHAPRYDALRTRFLTGGYSSLHSSAPRTVPPAAWSQSLYESALLLMRHPSLLPHLSPSSLSPTSPLLLAAVPSAALALLVLLHGSAPVSVPVRVDASSCELLVKVAASHPDAEALLRHLLRVSALLRVAGLRHAPAHAPRDLALQPFPPLRARWSPDRWFGYEVDSDIAAAALGMAVREREVVSEEVLKRVQEKVGNAEEVAGNMVREVEKKGKEVETMVECYRKARRRVVRKAREEVQRPVVDLFDEGVGGQLRSIADEAKREL